MQTADRHLWEYQWVRELALLALIALLAMLAYSIRAMLSPIIIGFALAYVFNPVVTWAERKRRIPRWTSTSLILFVGASSFFLLALWTVPLVIQQTATLLGNLRSYVRVLASRVHMEPEQMQTWFNDFTSAWLATDEGDATEPQVIDADSLPPDVAEELGDAGVTDDASAAPAQAADQAEANGGEATAADAAMDNGASEQVVVTEGPIIVDGDANASGDLPWASSDILNEEAFDAIGKVVGLVFRGLDIGVGVVGGAFALVSYLVLAIVIIGFCFFFFSWKFDRITAWFRQFIPKAHRKQTMRIIRRMDASVSAFIRGRLVQAFVMGVVVSIGWGAVGVPYWLLLGMLAGVLNLVPFAASVIWVVALGLALIDHIAAGGGLSFWVIFWPSLVYGFAQFLDGWVVEPLVQGKATNLDPLTVLLAVLIGGSIAGLLGLLIAIPVTACLKILAEEVLIPQARRYLSDIKLE